MFKKGDSVWLKSIDELKHTGYVESVNDVDIAYKDGLTNMSIDSYEKYYDKELVVTDIGINSLHDRSLIGVRVKGSNAKFPFFFYLFELCDHSPYDTNEYELSEDIDMIL